MNLWMPNTIYVLTSTVQCVVGVVDSYVVCELFIVVFHFIWNVLVRIVYKYFVFAFKGIRASYTEWFGCSELLNKIANNVLFGWYYHCRTYHILNRTCAAISALFLSLLTSWKTLFMYCKQKKKIRTTLDGRVRQPNRRKSDKILFSHDQNHFQFSYFLCYAVMWHEKIGFIFISMEGKIHADSTVGLNFYCRFNSTLKIKTT